MARSLKKGPFADASHGFRYIEVAGIALFYHLAGVW